MRLTLRRLLSTLCVLGATLALTPAAFAADHLDAPAAMADPAADINDVYVFRSTDSDNPANADRTVFVMTVTPFADLAARFSDAVTYEFVITDTATGTEHLISCTATPEVGGAQTMTCTTPGGTPSLPATFNDPTDGVRAAGGVDIIVFAGLRDDPFFFDLEAFRSVLMTGDPTPLVDTDEDGTDTFAGQNTLAIVVDVKNEVFGGATTLAVWGRTVRQGN